MLGIDILREMDLHFPPYG